MKLNNAVMQPCQPKITMDLDILDKATIFPGIPEELVELIACQLDFSDLLSLRLVCIELGNKTFHYFSRKYFKEIPTNLSLQSLQKLKELSQNEKVKHEVHGLLVKAPTWPFKKDMGQGFTWERHPSGRLVVSQPAVRMLAEILCSLVNCRSFRISRVHRTDLSDAKFLSTFVTPSDAVKILLSIISEKRLNVRSFHIDFAKRYNNEIDAHRIECPTDYGKRMFQHAWEHLQELKIEFCMRQETSRFTMALMTSAKNLRKLTLHPAKAGEDVWFPLFMDQLSAKGMISPKLEELHLRCMQFKAESFIKLLSLVQNSLRILSFHHVILAPGGTWEPIFQEVKTKLPLLQDFSVSKLWERSQHQRPQCHLFFPVLYKEPIVPKTGGRKFEMLSSLSDTPGYRNLVGCRYQGPRMDLAMGILQRSIVRVDKSKCQVVGLMITLGLRVPQSVCAADRQQLADMRRAPVHSCRKSDY